MWCEAMRWLKLTATSTSDDSTCTTKTASYSRQECWRLARQQYTRWLERRDDTDDETAPAGTQMPGARSSRETGAACYHNRRWISPDRIQDTGTAGTCHQCHLFIESDNWLNSGAKQLQHFQQYWWRWRWWQLLVRGTMVSFAPSVKHRIQPRQVVRNRWEQEWPRGKDRFWVTSLEICVRVCVRVCVCACVCVIHCDYWCCCFLSDHLFSACHHCSGVKESLLPLFES